MWCVLRKILIQPGDITRSTIKETKRFAGHSKWSNIKHAKAAADAERATVFLKLSRQMKVAITEGGSCKPTENLKLAQTIEIAKKKFMPMATINNVLEKAAKATTKSQSAIIDVRGPGGCVILIEVHSENLKRTKMDVQSIIKKFNATVTDQSVRHVFHHRGIILTNLVGNLDSATEIAIIVGAEDVEEIEQDGDKYFQFTCEARNVAKVANQLASQKYEVVSTEEVFEPHVYAHLSDSDVDRIATLFRRLENIPEVYKLHDNIA